MAQQITVSKLRDMVQVNGMTRDQIAQELEITRNEVNKLFKHEKLKGLKPGKPASFILVDDTNEGYQESPKVEDAADDVVDASAEEPANENTQEEGSDEPESGWDN